MLRLSKQYIKFILILAGIMSVPSTAVSMTIIISIILSIIVKIADALISPFLASQNKIMNFIGTLIVTGLIGISIYSILILIAISTSEQDFLWTLGFLVQFAQDFFVADPLTCLL